LDRAITRDCSDSLLADKKAEPEKRASHLRQQKRMAGRMAWRTAGKLITGESPQRTAHPVKPPAVGSSSASESATWLVSLSS